jgi:MFS family permease
MREQRRAAVHDSALRPPGRIYYGWVVLLSLAVAQVTSWGVLYYAFTVFLTPMRHELGWSTAALTGGFSLALLVSGVAALPVGAWVDRHGPRLLMTVGSCAAVALVVGWSLVHTLIGYYLIWAGIGLVMAAVFYEPAFVTVTAWFTSNRGRAFTVLTFVAGFASVVYVPLAGWLVGAQGWRMALVTLAVLLGVGTIPLHAGVLRRPPRASFPRLSDVEGAAPHGEEPDANERSITLGAALRDAEFWALAAAFFLATLTSTALAVHLIPYLIEEGYGASFAALAAGLIGLAAMPGRVIFTPLGDVLPRGHVTAAIFALQAIALVVLLRAHSHVSVLAFVVLFGAGFGAITPARAALVADAYGREHYGRINGVLAMVVMGARSLAPVGVGVLLGLLGSYTPILWALAAGSALAAAVMVLGTAGRGHGARAGRQRSA